MLVVCVETVVGDVMQIIGANSNRAQLIEIMNFLKDSLPYPIFLGFSII